MGDVPAAVKLFRARFAAAEQEERSRQAPSDDARLRECLDLHALNLLIDIERAKARPDVSILHEAIARANRERLATAPIPPSLLSRWRQRDDAV